MTHMIQREFDQAIEKNSEQADQICDKLIKNQDPTLSNLALELRKSNKFLFLNFCQFNDLINIQNDTFTQHLKEFDPENLIRKIALQTNEFFDKEPVLKFDQIPTLVMGDDYRLTYILACMMENSVKRNRQFEDCGNIGVSVKIEDENEIKCSEEFFTFVAG